jgi:hypothetical protein
MAAYTNIDDPSAYFQTALWTGGGTLSPRSITNDANSGDFQPDFVWTKGRATAYEHQLYDSSRGAGATKGLCSNDNTVEGNYGQYGYLSSFDSNGFTGTSGTSGQNAYYNVSGQTYAAWQWKANGGTTASNSDGSITSTVQANTDAGFSIVTYTGNATNNATVGHGLGAALSVLIIKDLTDGSVWGVWHKDLTDAGYRLTLSTSDAQTNDSGFMGGGNRTLPTSSVFSLGGGGGGNGNNAYIAYCFAEKQGYSKFGKYVGNGNANGPFVYLGFTPAFLIIKRTDTTQDWVIHDFKLGKNSSAGVATGSQWNENDNCLLANSSQVQNQWGRVDLVSNGFKVRSGGGPSENASGGTYIYMAFAESPFTTSTGIPTTAR